MLASTVRETFETGLNELANTAASQGLDNLSQFLGQVTPLVVHQEAVTVATRDLAVVQEDFPDTPEGDAQFVFLKGLGLNVPRGMGGRRDSIVTHEGTAESEDLYVRARAAREVLFGLCGVTQEELRSETPEIEHLHHERHEHRTYLRRLPALPLLAVIERWSPLYPGNNVALSVGRMTFRTGDFSD